MKNCEWSVRVVRVWDPGNEVIFWRENECSPRFVKDKQLRSSAKSIATKTLFFFCIVRVVFCRVVIIIIIIIVIIITLLL